MTVFLDTNVLLYADDADAGPKTEVSRRLVSDCLRARTGVVSTQVLQEYYVNACRKLGLERSAARARVDLYLGFQVVTVAPALILSAIDLHRLDQLSFWDALVVRAAESSGCDVLWSEDLKHGRRFGGVRVANPFVPEGGAPG